MFQLGIIKGAPLPYTMIYGRLGAFTKLPQLLVHMVVKKIFMYWRFQKRGTKFFRHAFRVKDGVSIRYLVASHHVSGDGKNTIGGIHPTPLNRPPITQLVQALGLEII